MSATSGRRAGNEQRHGRVLEARAAGRGSGGVTEAEANKIARLGVDEPARVSVARRFRARYAAGRGEVVAGYSVAAKPGRVERPIWFGGGRLDVAVDEVGDAGVSVG